MLIAVAALLLALPPLAPGAYKDARQTLARGDATVDVDVSDAAASLRDQGCHLARLVFDASAIAATKTASLSSAMTRVPAQAIGRDRRGYHCKVDVVVAVGPKRVAPSPVPPTVVVAAVAPVGHDLR